jgi:phosphinothricin acetyltransferase
MMSDRSIRDATRDDVPSLLAIHNEVVATTNAIYDKGASTLEERLAWFDDRTRQGYPVLVLESDGVVAGFSSFGQWRPRWGYRHSVEHSVHVRGDFRGQGIGTALMEALFARAIARDVHAMLGHIDSKSAASLRMHQRLGFETVGIFREVSRLHGGWLNLVAVQKLFAPQDS